MHQFLNRTVVAVLLVAGARALDAQPVNVSQRVPSRSDSLVRRILNSDVTEVRRIVGDWRAQEQRLITELRAAPQEDFPTRRRLEDELAQHVRIGFQMMSALETRCPDAGGAQPKGYLGLNIETSGRIINDQPQNMITVVTSVEPGSPAARAGLARKDKVVSIGGVEPHRMGEVGTMLVPGRTLLVRVERESEVREFSLIVQPRPDGFGESCGEFEHALLPMRLPGRVMVRERMPVPRSGGTVRVETRDSTAAAPQEMRLIIFGAGPDAKTAPAFFAGAEFRALDEDWRTVLGVRQGVIVGEVAAGSPMAASGLKGGDVITAVGSAPVATPVTLAQLLAASQDREVTLHLVRAKQRRTVTLKLGQR
jgi:membrane-associated protease RseP (regulator of RpoE activity)